MAKLGPNSAPRLHVQTEERAMELLDLCNKREIQVIIGIEPDKQEDIRDIERIRRPLLPVKAPPRIGRNDYCPCGSGKKYKKCCEGRTVGS